MKIIMDNERARELYVKNVKFKKKVDQYYDSIRKT